MSVFGTFHGDEGSVLGFIICMGVLAGLGFIFFPDFMTSTFNNLFGLNPK